MFMFMLCYDYKNRSKWFACHWIAPKLIKVSHHTIGKLKNKCLNHFHGNAPVVDPSRVFWPTSIYLTLKNCQNAFSSLLLSLYANSIWIRQQFVRTKMCLHSNFSCLITQLSVDAPHFDCVGGEKR